MADGEKCAAEAEAATATATATPEKKSWADVEEEEEKKQKDDAAAAAAAASAEATTSSAPPAVEEKAAEVSSSSAGDALAEEAEKIQALSLEDERELLEDPEDSQIKAVTSGDTVYESASKFEDLNLSEELLKGLYVEMAFSRPSKIQAVTLPMILTPPYKDLVAQAHNGSGKTTCFVLGMLSRVNPKKKIPQAICICPTRELALQNQSVLSRMGKFTGIESICAVSTDKEDYVPVAKLPVVTQQVVIGTPGTINKWIRYKKLVGREMNILVFDEADHMLAEDGFRDDSERIMREMKRESPRLQVLLFSATFNDTVKGFVSKVVRDGNQIFVKKEELPLDKVKQYKVRCPDEMAKVQVIRDKILEFGQKVGQVVIFVRTRDSAQRLHQVLTREDYTCTAIQGALGQQERDKVIKEFKDGYTKILIATDVLARGFDQAQVNLVINYDLPVKYHTREPDYEVYLHRIGRAGRFGRKGAVFNLMCNDMDTTIMNKIEQYFQHNIPVVADWSSEDQFEAALKDAGLM